MATSRQQKEFQERLRRLDELAAKKKAARAEKKEEKREEKAVAKRVEGDEVKRKIPPPVEPDKETGWYKAHVIHYGLGLQFDMLFDPKNPGAALMHGATIRVSAKRNA